MKKIIISILVIALFLLFFLTYSYSSTEKLEIYRFISPETCSECHLNIYNQWQNSMHNLSHQDVVYRSLSEFLLKDLVDKNEIDEAESCIKCHIPIGAITGKPTKTSENSIKVSKLASNGIQCDYCHSAKNCKKIYNNGLIIDPGFGENNPGVKRGPYKNSESYFHETKFSELHTKSEICGTCHNVKHIAFGTNLDTTYDEWKNGPYNNSNPAKKIECQGCHMYQLPDVPSTGSTFRYKNPGYASEGGPKRKHIFTHYFVGANCIVPDFFNDKIKIKMAEDNLKNAATVEINTNQIEEGKIKIKVTNSGAGHYLPTGLTDFRQMWLQVTVKDSKDDIIFKSGYMDEKHYLLDNTIIYNTVFGDEKGNKIINIAKAKQVLKDNRIPPLKSVEHTIILPINKIRKETIVIAKLLYRSAPQKLIDKLMKEKNIKIPIITMAEAKTKIQIF